MKILKCQQESFLQSIFRILGVPKHLSCSALKPRHARCEKMIQFYVAHIHRQRLGFLRFRDCLVTPFVAQATLPTMF